MDQIQFFKGSFHQIKKTSKKKKKKKKKNVKT